MERMKAVEAILIDNGGDVIMEMNDGKTDLTSDGTQCKLRSAIIYHRDRNMDEINEKDLSKNVFYF